MKRNRSAKSVLVIAALMTASIGFAGESPSADASSGGELSLADLMNIKLKTGSFLDLDLSKSPLSMTIIDRTQIKVSGARHLSELLEVYVPGFVYMYNKWGGITWAMRGISNDKNDKFIVLVNGHKLNTEASEGFFQETNIGLFGDVERIEVLRGPAGLVYGSGAIAGIVNIVTREFTESKIEVTAGAGTWGSFDRTSKTLDGVAFAQPAPGQNIVISAGYQNSDGVAQANTRIYGIPEKAGAHWSYIGPDYMNDPSVASHQNGTIPDQPAWAMPGNWRTSLDWNWDKFRLYTRFTHQEMDNGQFFPINLAGLPASAFGLNDSTLSKDNGKDYTTLAGQNTFETITWPDGTPITAADYLLMSGKAADFADYSRRRMIADNISSEAKYNYDIPGSEDVLTFTAGFDANSMTYERTPDGYPEYSLSDVITPYNQTYGEKRYSLKALYLLKRVPNLQSAVGAEYRYDDIGDDMMGNNVYSPDRNIEFGPVNWGTALGYGWPGIAPVQYQSAAVYTENFYDVSDALGISAGLRWDIHSQTAFMGGTLNGKLAAVYTAAPGQVIKLIFQSSSNNGEAGFYNPQDPWGTWSIANSPRVRWGYINGAGVDQSKDWILDPSISPLKDLSNNVMHVPDLNPQRLKPEKVYSVELTSTHQLPGGLSVSPSVSWGRVNNLFAWAEPLRTTINTGSYDYVNAEGTIDYKSKYVDVGLSHTFQVPVNTDQTVQNYHFKQYNSSAFDSTMVNGAESYFIKDTLKSGRDYTVDSVSINGISQGVTTNGSQFLNIPSQMSKLQVNVKPWPWMTLHSDFRIFWAPFAGRDSLIQANATKGNWNYWNIMNDGITKWDMSANFDLGKGLEASFYVYDILGSATGNATASLRWQQMASPNQNDLFAMDIRSYAVKVTKAF